MNQNLTEHFGDMVGTGKMTADEANVELVRAERVRVINGAVPAQVRRALNAAVKAGCLGHMGKQKLKPEVYYHPNFKYLANEQRDKIERESLQRIAMVM